MRSLRIKFDGASRVSIDWNGEVSGISSVAQHVGVALMTQRGSDKFLPARGTDVAKTLLSYGVFDLLGMQHILNFGALKARSDIQAYESAALTPEDRLTNIKTTLIDVKDNVARVGIVVTNNAGQTTREITSIA